MWGETYPLSNCIPSTTSRVVSRDFASSTVITPVSPTFAIASAISLPISSSPAEIEATCSISSFDWTFLAFILRFLTTSLAALSIPFFIKIGFAPALTTLRPSFTIFWAKIVAVVVPSPATSFAFVATSFISFAPRFSKGSSSSISLAIETPSFVIRGEP